MILLPILVYNQSRALGFFHPYHQCRATWNGNDTTPAGVYVVNLAFPFNHVIGAFVETFGSIQRGNSTIHFDTGLAWLITPDLQLDLYGGIGNNNSLRESFLSIGVSWRTTRKSIAE